MRRSVTVQQRDRTVNDFGERTESWTDIKSLGAIIRPLSLTEITPLNRELNVSVLQFDFTLSPTSSAITTDNRLVYSGRNYDVISVTSSSNRSFPMSVRVIAEERT